jgi:hypothetical protein
MEFRCIMLSSARPISSEAVNRSRKSGLTRGASRTRLRADEGIVNICDTARSADNHRSALIEAGYGDDALTEAGKLELNSDSAWLRPGKNRCLFFNACDVPILANPMIARGAKDPLGATPCAFFSSNSIGMKGKHIGPVIVAGHIQVEFAPRDIVQIQVRS